MKLNRVKSQSPPERHWQGDVGFVDATRLPGRCVAVRCLHAPTRVALLRVLCCLPSCSTSSPALVFVRQSNPSQMEPANVAARMWLVAPGWCAGYNRDRCPLSPSRPSAAWLSHTSSKISTEACWCSGHGLQGKKAPVLLGDVVHDYHHRLCARKSVVSFLLNPEGGTAVTENRLTTVR